MRTKIRKPKRKKSRFKFCTKSSAGYLMKHGDSFTYKQVGPVKHLGDFGYHKYFLCSYTVFHLPTGLEFDEFDNKRDAIVLIKRLFLKNIKVRIDPNEIIPLIQLASLANSLTTKGVYVTHRTIKDSVDDIPF